MTAPDLPDWWGNQLTTSPHPPPTTLHTATMKGATATGTLIGVPSGGQFIRLWAVAASVIATAGSTGYIDFPVGSEDMACQVGQSVNLSFAPSGMLVAGTSMVVNTFGSVYFTITAVYDLTL